MRMCDIILISVVRWGFPTDMLYAHFRDAARYGTVPYDHTSPMKGLQRRRDYFLLFTISGRRSSLHDMPTAQIIFWPRFQEKAAHP